MFRSGMAAFSETVHEMNKRLEGGFRSNEPLPVLPVFKNPTGETAGITGETLFEAVRRIFLMSRLGEDLGNREREGGRGWGIGIRPGGTASGPSVTEAPRVSGAFKKGPADAGPLRGFMDRRYVAA